jgi:hypothetical protein
LQNTSGENKEAHPKDETSLDSLSIREELLSNEALASVSGGADGALGKSSRVCISSSEARNEFP